MANISKVPANLVTGSGSDALVLSLSEDAYLGNALYTVRIDGHQVGAQFMARAQHGSASDTLTIRGDWVAGAHTVEVTLLNDRYDGTSATDRNLYIDSLSFDSVTIAGSSASLMSNGPTDLAFTKPGPQEDRLTIYLSGDAWNGNAQATLTVNGKPVGGVLDVAAVHARDDVSAFTLTGSFGPNPTVGLSFINDAYGGSPGTDRNLYLSGFDYDGASYLGTKNTLGWNQTQTYSLSAAPQSAMRAADLLNGLGVCVHLDYTDTAYGLPDGSGPNTQRVLSTLGYLGVNSVRVGLPDATTLPAMKALAAAGYKLDILMPSASSDAQLSTQLASLHQLTGAIISIEGPNEIDITHDFSWNGQAGNAAGRAYQHALYTAVHADQQFAGVKVLGLTLGGAGTDGYAALGDISADVDAGTMHVYYVNSAAPASTIRYALGLSAIDAPGKPAVFTETNYTSAPGIPGSVTEAVQAKYDLDLLMDCAKAGVQATDFYELLDLRADPGQTDNNLHYGLFHSDGTPKPAATAIHNLTSILADATPYADGFTPGSLSYTLLGLPASGNTMLIQKASGEYDLVIWAEPEIWSVATQSEVPATARTVSVAFATEQANIAVFDPMHGTTPTATYAHASTISLSVTDHPLVIQVGGPVWA